MNETDEKIPEPLAIELEDDEAQQAWAESMAGDLELEPIEWKK